MPTGGPTARIYEHLEHLRAVCASHYAPVELFGLEISATFNPFPYVEPTRSRSLWRSRRRRVGHDEVGDIGQLRHLREQALQLEAARCMPIIRSACRFEGTIRPHPFRPAGAS